MSKFSIINKRLFFLVLLTLSVFTFQTIVYAAISSSLVVKGLAYSRPEADVRITKFSIADATEATISMYEEFNKEKLSANITLPTSSSYIIYKVEVTNYGSIAAGITSITGLPTGLTYELTNYTLKDKICDINNNCTGLAKKEFYIKISGTAGQYIINLTLSFSNFYNITYKNLTDSSYPNEIIGGESLTLDVSNTIMNKFYAENASGSFTPTLSGTSLSIGTINSDTTIIGEQETKFSYTGDYQTFTVPATAVYKVELWGAGGSDCGNSSYGGYTKGEITFNKDTKLYLYLGGRGTTVTLAGVLEGTGGWNGGGNADNSGYSIAGARCGGSGATDIRLVSGEWNDFESLKSRIMVAGASGSYSQAQGGSAGGLTGYQSLDVYNTSGVLITPTSYGGTQTSGGQGTYSELFKGNGTPGGFGYGGNGHSYASGGGGGYYGGAGGTRHTSDSGGAGGSSFISGHNGCVAIKEESTSDLIVHKEDATGTTCTDGTTDITCSYHYSGYIFENTIMIDGNGYSWTNEKGTEAVKMPSPIDSSLITGTITKGYAKITLIELK